MKDALALIGVLCVAAAMFFSYYGISMMYDDSYQSRIVGGDAYNFIIYATRGTAYIGVGVICAVLSVFFMLLSNNYSSTGKEDRTNN